MIGEGWGGRGSGRMGGEAEGWGVDHARCTIHTFSSRSSTSPIPLLQSTHDGTLDAALTIVFPSPPQHGYLYMSHIDLIVSSVSRIMGRTLSSNEIAYITKHWQSYVNMRELAEDVKALEGKEV